MHRALIVAVVASHELQRSDEPRTIGKETYFGRLRGRAHGFDARGSHALLDRIGERVAIGAGAIRCIVQLQGSLCR